MRPLKTIVRPPILTPYLSPDDRDFTDLECWQEGGIALSDGSSGLQYQVWHLQVIDEPILGTGVWLDAENMAPLRMFSLPGITWARFSFDQNMHPVIAFMADTGVGFWWWNPTVPGVVFTYLNPATVKPCVTMDDKRDMQTLARNNDVVICYLLNGDLKFRLERDRYQVEYLWLDDPYSDYFKQVRINKIGMSEGLRLRLQVFAILDP